MILARALTKADFGVAAAFSLITTLLEMSDKLGMARFVVRDKEGDDETFVNAAHLVHFGAGILSAFAIVLCAHPLSRLFGIPDHSWAVSLLGVVPLLRGLEHLDVRRFERQLRFAPSLLVEALPQMVMTATAWPMVLWLGDYRAVLVLLLAKAVITCVGSHVVAERRYAWAYHEQVIRRMLWFGWPLLVNGFLMFGVLQGDQFLIAASYTMSNLAPYAAAATLSMAPTFFFGRVFNTLMLPLLAAVQDDADVFRKRYRSVLAVVTVFAVLGSVALISGGEAIMQAVYGSKYAGAGVLLGWLAAANAFRNLRIAPALAAIAKGDSQNQMIANLWRIVALAPAAGVAWVRGPLWAIACVGLLGEALACTVSFLRLKKRDQIPLIMNVRPAAAVLAAVAVSGVLASLGSHHLAVLPALAFAAAAAAAGAGMAIFLVPELRGETVMLRNLLHMTQAKRAEREGLVATSKPPLTAK
jgi:O-antigen/teichoic acid export membrane protein